MGRFKTKLSAGHETVATTLAWTWYLLGPHPEVGAGQHLCIGKSFAVTEATIILAAIAQRFQIELVPQPRVEAYAQQHLAATELILNSSKSARDKLKDYLINRFRAVQEERLGGLHAAELARTVM
ncbi:MAG: cytochrome P450 [Spirulinaceae cyanobacterium]